MTSKILTAPQAEAYKLRHDDGLSFRAIGDRLGLSVRAVFERVRRAEKKLDHKPGPVPAVKNASLAERAQGKRAEADKFVKNFATADVLALMEDRRIRALLHLDDERLAAETSRGLAQIAGVLTEKIQLLKDEPTAIIKIQDVRKLDEIGKMLLDEAKRRGLVVEGEVVDKKPEKDDEEAA